MFLAFFFFFCATLTSTERKHVFNPVRMYRAPLPQPLHTTLMKRRSFVKKSVAAVIVTATPLALTGLVNAAGGGSGSSNPTTTTEPGTTTEGTTGWWTTTEEATTTEGTTDFFTTSEGTTVDADHKCVVNGNERKFSHNGNSVCATMMTCGSAWHQPTQKKYRSPMRNCVIHGIDTCSGFPDRIALSGQDATDFANRVECSPN